MNWNWPELWEGTRVRLYLPLGAWTWFSILWLEIGKREQIAVWYESVGM